jgi:hypothetical protein
MEFRNHRDRLPQHLLIMPFIYFMIVPAVFLDITMEIYHRICFPLCGMDYVPRSNYIKIDRHKLSKLNPLEKINCAYCGYVNGLLAYAVQVGAKTESYWCGIKHRKETLRFLQPDHHEDFIEYEEMK